MAGFEIVVRPVVFPNIRPQPARSLPPANDPDQGFAVIRGNGAKALTLSDSWSISTSSSRPTETERRVDEMRVHQMDNNGKVNKKNFVDIEVTNRIKMNGGAAPTARLTEVPTTNEERKQLFYYRQAQEAKNIVKLKTNVIKKNEQLENVQL
jgi:hypothetical protein